MKRILLFCVSCLIAMTTFAAELNIYASGLKAGGMSADKKVQVEYLLNAPATAVEIHVLNADNTVAISLPVTDAALLTKGAHSATVDVSSLAVGEYRWEVKATAEANETSQIVAVETRTFSTPRGLDIDKNPANESFGNIYVSDPVGAVSEGAGIWLYRPDMTTPLVNTPYMDGEFNPKAASPMHVFVAQDGLVYVSDWGDLNPNITIFDPANPTAPGKKVFKGESDGDGVEKDGDGVAIHGSMVSAYALGTGADRKLFTIDEDIITYGKSAGNIYRYDIGELTATWEKAPSAIYYNDTLNKIQNMCNKIYPDYLKGGVWIGQHRYTDASSIPSFMHMKDNGELDYVSGSLGDFNNRGTFTINKEGTLLVTPALSALKVYEISYVNDSAVLTLKESIASVVASSACYDVAFDYAGNVFAVNNGSVLKAVALAKADNSAVTPAPATQPIKVESTVVAVTGVTLDKTSADMKVGEQLTLVATVAPDDATNKSVAWTSSDAEVAAVSADGTVSALKAGTATITVTTQDGEKTATCAVAVTNVDVESIVLDKTAATIYKGETLQLNATIAPANATNKSIAWTTSDEAVATVDAEGLVVAVGTGSATITATTEDKQLTAACAVTVPEGAYPNIYAYGLKLESTADGVTVGFNLNAPATQVRVLAYDAEQNEYVVATVSDAKAEYQTVELNTADLPAGTYTWAVEAQAELVTEDDPVLVRQYATNTFKSPRGLAIDNNVNSQYFGQIYVTDGGDGAAAEVSGLYIFDPKLNGGDSLYTTGWSASKASPMRPTVGEDGLVYITDWSDNAGNIHIFNPATMAEETPVFGGTFSGAKGIWNTDDGKFIHGSISGCYVTGTGADRVLYTFDEDYNNEAMAMLRYDIGALETPWAAEPSAVAYDNADKYEQNGDSKIIPSVAGGWWISQDRATDSQEIPALIHVSKDGVVDFNSNGTFGGRTRGAVTFNEDQTYCFSAADNAIRINEVTWTDGVPAIKTLIAIPTTFGAQNSSSCYDIAVDRAGNVYASGDGKSLCVWAVYKDENLCVTPAAEGLTFEVVETGIETLDAQKLMKKGVYSVTGQYLGETFDVLQSGVYIINGKKVVK